VDFHEEGAAAGTVTATLPSGGGLPARKPPPSTLSHEEAAGIGRPAPTLGCAPQTRKLRSVFLVQVRSSPG
jgi:hypothetical protein